MTLITRAAVQLALASPQLSVHHSIRAALAAQYDAFRMPAPRLVEGCSCCTSPEELESLVTTPRQALSAEQLEFYASNALLTVGGIEDLRHYWPRLAELSIAGELLTDAEIVFAKPRHGDWRSWPSAEQEALSALTHAQLEALVSDGGRLDDYAVETWVCAFGQFLDDVTVILAPLLEAEPGPAAALRGWYALNKRSLAKRKLWSAFWESAPNNAEKVLNWFAQPHVQTAIERAFTFPSAAG
jgi:hypothetical protein